MGVPHSKSTLILILCLVLELQHPPLGSATVSSGRDGTLYMTVAAGVGYNVSIIPTEWLGLGFNVTPTSKLPSWITFDEKSAIFHATPDEQDVGSHKYSFHVTREDTCRGAVQQVNVKVKDAGNKDSCKFRPVKKKPVNHISAIAGQPFHYQIRDDAFEDVEDGSTHHLSLELKSISNLNSNPDTSWLLLDTANQTLFGLPLDRDAMETEVVGLSAVDACGLRAVDAVSVNVNVERHPHYAFVMYFDSSFTSVIVHKSHRFKLVLLIEDWLKQKIQVFDIDAVNRTLTWALVDDVIADKCDDTVILEILRNMTNENSSTLDINPNFNCHLSPFFKLQELLHVEIEACFITFDHNSVTNHAHSDFRYWLEVILPALVFLILFIILVVFLYYMCGKSRKTRGRYVMNVDQSTLLEERQPVILQNDDPADDPSLKPRHPIIISPADDPPGQGSSGIEVRERSGPAPPEVIITADGSPPQYRLPPPYKSQHQYW